VSEPRGSTVTLLFADIAGSTRLLAALGEDYPAVLADYRRLMADAAAAERGTLIDTAGDGLFYSFPTARGALNAALVAQRAFRDHEWPSDAQLEARMGIHTGEPVSAESSLIGIDVHRAARICAAGHGGQVLLSVTTHELLGGPPADVVLRDLGEHHLKDLDRPERVYQATSSGMPAEFPPLRSLDNWPNNLPRQLSTFVGREDALEAVTAQLATTPLLTLVGPGGVGKTRLAMEAADRAMDTVPDGVWVVELASLDDGSLIPETIASTLHVKEQPGVPVISTLALHIGERRILLLFDDCDHVLGAVAEVVDELLRGCAGLRVLATSREALGIPGETLFPVGSMSLPAPEAVVSVQSLETIAEVEAVRLFVDRARAVQPSFALTERNAVAVAQICRRLDGIPLAIELAAARVRALPPEQIAARLDDRFRLLTGGSRTALPRHRTLKATMDWSFELLTDAERTLFVRLAVFAGSFDLDAAEAVGSGDPVDRGEVLDLLSRLIDRSLVDLEETPNEARYRLLDTIQQYGQERLVEADPAGEVRARHRAHVLWLVEQLAPRLFAGPDAAPTAERLALDHENIRAALQACDADPAGAADELRLAGNLWRYWEMSGLLAEGRGWLTRALARTDGEVSELRANALSGLGSLAAQQGDLASAEAGYAAALATNRELGRPAGIAYAASNVANIASERGDFSRARELYEESIAITREMGDERAAAIAVMSLADVLGREGQVEEATRLFDEAVAIFRGTGDPFGLALALGRDATFRLSLGDTADARAKHEEALETYRRFGDGRGVARTLMFLGDIVAVEGDNVEAERHYRAGIEERRALGDRAGLAAAADRVARLLVLSEPERAARLVGFAEAQRDAIGASLAPVEAAERDQLVAALQARLGPEFSAFRNEGRRSPLDAALGALPTPAPAGSTPGPG
jgi:predicted ATPase/class 3 adenylate cyclase